MDLYLTEKATGTKVALSLLPDEVKAKGTVSFTTYDFIVVGEVKTPSGNKAQTFSWTGTFPGSAMKNMPFVKKQHWKAPKEMVAIFEKWRKNKTRLVLMLTETPLNCEVHLSSFEAKYNGGVGNIEYSVTFTEAGETTVTAVSVKTNTAKQSTTNTTNSRAASNKTASATKTYTVKWGDCPWSIAVKYYGDGTKWPKIIDANQWLKERNAKRGVIYYMLYVGDKLTIP